MGEAQKGVLALCASCTVWGLSGIYYKALSHVPPEQVLSHRALWSFVFFAIVLLCQGRIAELGAALSTRRSALLLAFASAMISLNWFIFISAVQLGYATEASLGYYVFPLLEGDRLIGRIDMKRTKNGALSVTALWLEPRLSYTRARKAKLEAQLDRLADFVDAEAVRFEKGFLKT